MKYSLQKKIIFGSVCVLIYLLVSGAYFLKATGAFTLQSITHLHTAQAELFSNPTKAGSDFKLSGDAAKESLNTMQHIPWLLRLAAPIPPFSWNIYVLKANYSLALAGQNTSQLILAFPSAKDTSGQDLSTLLRQGSSSYFTWEDQHQKESAQLIQQLDTAKLELAHVPAWAVLGQGKQFNTFRDQVTTLEDQLRTFQSSSQLIHQELGSTDQKEHTILLLFPTSYNQNVYAVITGKGGIITRIQFLADQEGLYKEYAADASHLIWPDVAKAVSQKYTAASGQEVAGVISADTTFFKALLNADGPLLLPGNPATLTANNLDTQKPDALALIPPLVSSLSQSNNGGSKAYGVAKTAVKDKHLQLWASNSQLEAHIPD